MLFNSVAFAVFLPIVLVLYWALRNPRHQNVLLVAASLFFYGWWDPRFLSLLLLSVGVDYACALGVARARARGDKGQAWLGLSLCVNLGLLGVFKYYDFFIGSAESLWLQLGWHPGLLKIALPVGISFYTFQTMSYTIDVYRGEFEARRSLLDVAAYVTFFPQLVAGPIERASTLLPQLEKPRTVTREGAHLGLMLILVGLLKKMVLADGLAPFVDAVYGRAAAGDPISAAEALFATYAFAFQIYGDFSGYSDIARGVAHLLGIKLVINFRQPYFSRTNSEFWRRWHISLSFWLRDYLYIALGGSRRGKLLTLRNLVITMLLGGLWHGAAWTFVVWGGLIGVYLLVERLLGLQDPGTFGRGGRALGVVVVFHCIALSWVFFRASSFAAAWRILAALGTDWTLPPPDLFAAVSLGALLLLLIDLPHLQHPNEELPCAEHRKWRLATLGAAVAGFLLVPPVGTVQFIYFQF